MSTEIDNNLKKKLAVDGYSEVSGNIGQLKMIVLDGKQLAARRPKKLGEEQE